ncbi:MAG TPA: diaminopimelate decarboxylase [Flavobacteriales bacterium]|nr:diaminopimelate decarboxylase [Flavobacteriales bacterium]
MELLTKMSHYMDRETPFYHYDLDLLSRTLDAMLSASSGYGFHVHYALKANSNREILERISAKGLGADCVSGNEITRAIETGFKKEDIAFAGVGKTDVEIKTGIENDIFSFNAESMQELEVINEIARAMGKKAPIALRINPNVNAKTHQYITTGLEENKFGINSWEFETVLEKLENLKNLELKGLHFHIGSQITDMSVFKGLCIRINEIQKWFVEHRIIAEHINVGGGLGVNYDHPDEKLIPDFDEFFKIFHDHLELYPNQELHFELGRALVAQCGNLITRVLYIKNGVNVDFAIVDAGMTELIRPALYESIHRIDKISVTENSVEKKYDVVGPICESSDCFAKSIILPELKRGDLLAIRSAGAYGEVMSSGYNLRSKVKTYYSER